MLAIINIRLLNSMSAELDCVRIKCDSEDCTDEVIATIRKQHWVLRTGDSIEIQERS